MWTQLQTPLTTLGLALASSFGAIVFSTPAYSINVDLSTFDAIGDVSNSNTTISSGSTVFTSGGTGSLEEFLGIDPTNFNNAIPDTTYGSAIKQTLTFNAGDQFSFNWNFNTSDSDQAFVAIGNAISVLSGSNPYSYTFATSGNYQVAMGVLDVTDSTGISSLTLSNAQIQAVPWETDALPVVGTTLLFGIGIWKKYKSSNSNNFDLNAIAIIKSNGTPGVSYDSSR
jgi:hypothetical protein